MKMGQNCLPRKKEAEILKDFWLVKIRQDTWNKKKCLIFFKGKVSKTYSVGSLFQRRLKSKVALVKQSKKGFG